MISRDAERAPMPFDQPKLQNTVPQIKNSRRNPQNVSLFYPPNSSFVISPPKAPWKRQIRSKCENKSNRHGGRETKDPIGHRYLLRQTATDEGTEARSQSPISASPFVPPTFSYGYWLCSSSSRDGGKKESSFVYPSYRIREERSRRYLYNLSDRIQTPFIFVRAKHFMRIVNVPSMPSQELIPSVRVARLRTFDYRIKVLCEHLVRLVGLFVCEPCFRCLHADHRQTGQKDRYEHERGNPYIRAMEYITRKHHPPSLPMKILHATVYLCYNWRWGWDQRRQIWVERQVWRRVRSVPVAWVWCHKHNPSIRFGNTVHHNQSTIAVHVSASCTPLVSSRGGDSGHDDPASLIRSISAVRSVHLVAMVLCCSPSPWSVDLVFGRWWKASQSFPSTESISHSGY